VLFELMGQTRAGTQVRVPEAEQPPPDRCPTAGESR